MTHQPLWVCFPGLPRFNCYRAVLNYLTDKKKTCGSLASDDIKLNMVWMEKVKICNK